MGPHVWAYSNNLNHGDQPQHLPGMYLTSLLHIDSANGYQKFLVGAFASLGSFLYGYDLGVIGGSVAATSFVAEYSPNPDETYVRSFVNYRIC